MQGEWSSTLNDTPTEPPKKGSYCAIRGNSVKIKIINCLQLKELLLEIQGHC
jgi:hypothetical protein